jgi:hypothetical protein
MAPSLLRPLPHVHGPHPLLLRRPHRDGPFPSRLFSAFPFFPFVSHCLLPCWGPWLSTVSISGIGSGCCLVGFVSCVDQRREEVPLYVDLFLMSWHGVWAVVADPTFPPSLPHTSLHDDNNNTQALYTEHPQERNVIDCCKVKKDK